MKAQLDWEQILIEAEGNIRKAIKPCIITQNHPQPSLGKGAGGDLTKPVDLAAETAIVDTLKHHDISFTLISEEAGIIEFGNTPKDHYLCVDPIDGTTNFTRGLPFYNSSIAVSDKPELGAVFAGMVTDLERHETYIAIKGKGAYRNGKLIRTSKTQTLDEAVIGMDLNSYKSKLNIATTAALVENIRHTRHFGANALEVCYTAAGLTDAFIDLRNKIRTTDVAAGLLIAREAGAIVTDSSNQVVNVPLHPRKTLNFIASGNKEIHNCILSLINGNV